MRKGIEHEGKTFHFEMLDNGLIRTYDYECKWPLLFKKNENGEWKPENLNAMTEAYKGLAMKLNERKKPTRRLPTAAEIEYRRTHHMNGQRCAPVPAMYNSPPR